MNSAKRFLTFFLLILVTSILVSSLAQEAPAVRKIRLSLEEVIDLAKRQSPDALIAKHSFRASYWQYRTHVARFRPSISLEATLPELNRSISRITLSDGSDAFIERSLMSSSGNISLRQNIGLTGGSLFMATNLQRIDLLGDSVPTSYLSNPVSIGINQPLFAFNSLRWERKIEPLRYQEARQNYLTALENISMKAVGQFFDLALAQLNLQIARTNSSNADTLFKISTGRFNIGTISKNDLLQLELTYLNSLTELRQAELDLEIRKNRLRSFLGFREAADIELDIHSGVPEVKVEFGQALELALKNNPEVLQNQRQLLESTRDEARARSESRPNANLYASFGLTQSALDLPGAYKDPQNQQLVTVGLTVPILDWGLGRGRVRMAQSNRELVETQIRQRDMDFEQDVYLKVMQFNMQADQLRISAKADTVAQNRYDVTKQRFLIGKLDVLNLNDALREKDASKRSYLSNLRSFYTSYFDIRRLTLYDFLKNEELPFQPDQILR